MKLLLLAILNCSLLSSIAEAQVSSNFLDETQPRHELGFILIGLQTPFYPGAKQSKFRFFPFPFGIYRGDVLRADDEGTRARLINPTSYELGISLDFNFPVDSEDTNLRKGMPSLDSVIQIGPRFLYRFLTDNPLQKLNLSLAVRGAASTNFKSRFTGRGIAFEPQVSFWNRWPGIETTFFSYFSLSISSSELNSYFYDVDNSYVNTQRSPYTAKAGLIETTLGMGFQRNITDRISAFTAGSYRNLNWSANKDSPLVETKDNIGFVIASLRSNSKWNRQNKNGQTSKDSHASNVVSQCCLRWCCFRL